MILNTSAISSPTRLLAMLLLAILLAALLFAGFRCQQSAEPPTVHEPVPIGSEPAPESPPVDMEDTEAMAAAPTLPPVEPEPAQPEEPPFVLPELSNSDRLIREHVTDFTGSERVHEVLNSNELIRRFVVLVDNIGSGNVPRQQVEFLAPSGNFAARELGQDRYRLDPEGYARYDTLADIFVSVDTAAAFKIYRLLEPLFQRAFDELGYADRSFDAALLDAIAVLLEVPVVEGSIELTRPSVMFEYADPNLQKLGDAQKQLLRMGPRNIRRIQDKLREFSGLLRRRG